MKKNLLVITYWSYADALIQAYTLPYIRIIGEQLPPGSKIYFVTLEQKHQGLPTSERKKVQQALREEHIEWKPYAYRGFSIAAFLGMLVMGFQLIFLVFSRRIHTIHAWCMPAGAIGLALSKVTGKPLIIDSYEPHAEAMVENGTTKRSSFQFKLLFWLEKKITRHASVIISATAGMRNYAREKYASGIKRFYVKPACVDPVFFDLENKKDPQLVEQYALGDKIVCVYAGKFGGIYLTDEVFRFFSVAQEHWGDRFRALLLTNYPEEELKSWAKKIISIGSMSLKNLSGTKMFRVIWAWPTLPSPR